MKRMLQGNLIPAGKIRILRPSELPKFRDHLLRLDPPDRRDRFGTAASNDYVSLYADRCFHDGTTVLGYVVDDMVRGAAEIHELPDATPPSAEIAFSVERGWQRRGIGSRLFERLIALAKNFGYARLDVTTHPQNDAMKALARHFGASIHFEEGETVGSIDLDRLGAPSHADRRRHGAQPAL